MQEKHSLRERIVRYLAGISNKNPNCWVNGGQIEGLALEAGYKASNASRRLRELANEGLIERDEDFHGHVIYRYRPL